MLTSLINSCDDCSNLEDALCELDGAIAQLSKNSLQNLRYLTNKKNHACDIMVLLYYKEILLNLRWNPNFYFPRYSSAVIVSRVRTLVIGLPKIAKRWTLPTYTTTTTTSTTTTQA